MKVKKYLIFGLIFESIDLTLNGIPEISINSQTDVLIFESNQNEWPDLENAKVQSEILKISNKDLRLYISGVGNFRVLNGEKIFFCRTNANVSDQDLLAFILGSLIGAILIQREILVLHANALEKNGKGILCLGHKGYGKSSLAYVLSTRGWNFISDDIVAINKDGKILQGIPYIKVSPNFIEKLKINKKDIICKSFKEDKYLIKQNNTEKIIYPVKVQSIYLIRREEEYTKCERKNRIFNEKDILIHIINSVYRKKFVKAFEQESNQFQQITSLISEIQFFDLPVPNNLSQMLRWSCKINL